MAVCGHRYFAEFLQFAQFRVGGELVDDRLERHQFADDVALVPLDAHAPGHRHEDLAHQVLGTKKITKKSPRSTSVFLGQVSTQVPEGISSYEA